jgi:hypothetical protein
MVWRSGRTSGQWVVAEWLRSFNHRRILLGDWLWVGFDLRPGPPRGAAALSSSLTSAAELKARCAVDATPSTGLVPPCSNVGR